MQEVGRVCIAIYYYILLYPLLSPPPPLTSFPTPTGFMLRPGAQEVVDEAADLRMRYEALKKLSSEKLDEVAELLAKVCVFRVHCSAVLWSWWSLASLLRAGSKVRDRA